MRSGGGTQCATECALGDAAIGADREPHRLCGAKKAVQDRMPGFVIGEEAAQLRRQFRLAVAHGVEEILEVMGRAEVRAVCRAILTQRSASAPVCPRAASAAARRSVPARSRPRCVRKIPVNAGTSGNGMTTCWSSRPARTRA
jgi:hypothetical protein